MKSTLLLVAAALGLLVVACSSGADESSGAGQVEQQGQESATSYRAGESESVEAQSAEEVSEASEGVEQRGVSEGEEQREASEEAERVPDQVEDGSEEASERAGDGEQDGAAQSGEEAGPPQPSAAPPERGSEEAATGTDAEEEAMVARVIESGHRAGLVADRNVVGDPDAPIVITEYSDFL